MRICVFSIIAVVCIFAVPGLVPAAELTVEPPVPIGPGVTVEAPDVLFSGPEPGLRPLRPETKALVGPVEIIEGINFDEDAANNVGSYHIPPDPIGAAGPAHLVSVTNTSVEWHTKAGVQQVSQSLHSFFSLHSPLTDTFDPKVIYDQHAGRFLVITLERTTGPDTSRFFLAV